MTKRIVFTVRFFYFCCAMKYVYPTRFYFLGICLSLLLACNSEIDKENKLINHNILSECNYAIQTSIVQDMVPAPVGSRRYFYATVAAYESLQTFYSDSQVSLAGQYNGLTPAPKPDTTSKYCLDLVALSAHTYVAERLVYNADTIRVFRAQKLKEYEQLLSKQMFNNSIAFGDSVGSHIVAWSKKDSFAQFRGKFYLSKNTNTKWQPTPPDFTDAIEPYWGRIRPAGIKNVKDFKYEQPEPYAKNKNSRFYAITKQVYDEVNKKDSASLATAWYWDDNPNASFHYGHATVNVLKISPAGHWLALFSTVAKQKKYNLIQSAEGMVRVAGTIFDAFITCWHIKYETEYIRPIDAVRQLIDSTWESPIQTPAFPEYPSGHTVVSSSAATILTHLFGEVSFTDDSEEPFGLGKRKFNSFREAANQACISRLYGGIHFIDAIEKGKPIGNAIGQYHIDFIKTKK